MNLLWRDIFSPGSPANNVQETVLFNLRLAADLGSPYGRHGAGKRRAAISPSSAIPWWIPPFWEYPRVRVGAALAILLSFGIAGIQLCSFGFGLFAVLLTMLLSCLVNRHGDRTLTLLLCGIVTGTLFAAVLSLIKYVADPYSKLPAITYWLMGSLAAVNLSDAQTAAFWTLAGMIPLALLRWRITCSPLAMKRRRRWAWIPARFAAW